MTPLALRTLLRQLRLVEEKFIYDHLMMKGHFFDDGWDEWWTEEQAYDWSVVQPKLQKNQERRVL